jgi:multidrug resistance protein, MATE family
MRRRDVTLKDEIRALLPLAMPLALAQAGLATMGLVDIAIVGQVSPAAQGAVGVGNALFFFFGLMGIGIMMSLDPLISQAIGAGAGGHARSTLWQGGWLALFVTLTLWPFMAFSPLLLEPLGVAPRVAEGASIYLHWRMAQLFPMLLFTAVRAYLQGVAKPRPLWISVGVANVVNAGLCWLLVFGAGPIPALGVQGAAIATVLAGLAQLGICVAGLDEAPEGTQRALDFSIVKEAFKVGLPIGLAMTAEVGIFAFAGVLAGVLGEREVAAHQIVLTWSSFTFCFAVGVGQAAATRVGWAIGARDTAGARRAGLAALVLGLTVMVGFAALFLLFRGALSGLSSDDVAVREIAQRLFLIVAVYQVSDGLQGIGAGILRGAADTRFAFFANIVGHYGVGLPIAITLGLSGQGSVMGLWWGLCAGLTVVAVALVLRFFAASRGEAWAPLDRGQSPLLPAP